MHLSIRPAKTEDGTALVQMLDAAYSGGYSATFDRDGPLQPNDLWWVRSEKEVSLIEVDRRPSGLLVVGRGGRQHLVEELLIDGFSGYPGRTREALVSRMGAHLVGLFQKERQQALMMRVAESNAFGFAVARHLQATAADALLVHRHRGPKRPAATPPEGYEIRRATSADAREAGRLAREVADDRHGSDEIERIIGSKEGRVHIALKETFLAGMAAFEVRPSRVGWFVGVRETHRRRGLGRALAGAVVGALHARGLVPYSTCWALDPVSGPFLRALGFAVERTYLYAERVL